MNCCMKNNEQYSFLAINILLDAVIFIHYEHIMLNASTNVIKLNLDVKCDSFYVIGTLYYMVSTYHSCFLFIYYYNFILFFAESPV